MPQQQLHSDSLAGRVVEYQTSPADYYFGLVIYHNQTLDRVVLVDVDDGTRWAGNAERCSLADQA